MELQELLKKKRRAILRQWQELIRGSYPEQTAKFLDKQKDPFLNPVGAAITEETGRLFDKLLEGDNTSREARGFLDRVIRVRALQQFTPSQGLSFIFQLKGVIRSQLGEADLALEDEVVALETRIDEMALMAFDIYVSCRAKVYELQAKEMRSIFARALDRTGIFCEIPEQSEPDLA